MIDVVKRIADFNQGRDPERVAMIIARDDLRTALVGHRHRNFIEPGVQQIGNDLLHLPPGKQSQQRVQSRRMVASEAQASLIEMGDFRVDVERHQVLVRDVDVHLTPKEFDLLLYFVRNADRVLTHKVLLRAVWGAAGAEQPEYLRVLVAQLRKKIEPGGEPQYILSEPWVGYRLSPRPAGPDEARRDEDDPDGVIFTKS